MKGRQDEALTILNRIARINRKPKPHKLEIMVILDSCKDDRISNQADASPLKVILRTFKNIGIGYVNLVRTPELRRRSFLLWFLFIGVTLVYYGLAFNSALLTSDPFIMVFLG